MWNDFPGERKAPSPKVLYRPNTTSGICSHRNRRITPVAPDGSLRAQRRFTHDQLTFQDRGSASETARLTCASGCVASAPSTEGITIEDLNAFRVPLQTR